MNFKKTKPFFKGTKRSLSHFMPEKSNVEVSSSTSTTSNGDDAGTSQLKRAKKMSSLLPSWSLPYITCRGILEKIHKQPFGENYILPVEEMYDMERLPNYFLQVNNPMDLRTVEYKLEGGEYLDVDSFAADVRQIFINSMEYANSDKNIHSRAKSLLDFFNGQYEEHLRSICRAPLGLVSDDFSVPFDEKKEDTLNDFLSLLPPIEQEERKKSLSQQKKKIDELVASLNELVGEVSEERTMEIEKEIKQCKQKIENLIKLPPFSFEMKKQLTKKLIDLPWMNLVRVISLIRKCQRGVWGFRPGDAPPSGTLGGGRARCGYCHSDILTPGQFHFGSHLKQCASSSHPRLLEGGSKAAVGHIHVDLDLYDDRTLHVISRYVDHVDRRGG